MAMDDKIYGKLENLSDFCHTLDKKTILLDERQRHILEIQEKIHTELDSIRSSVSNLAGRQSADEHEKANRKAIFSAVWKNRSLILAALLVLFGLFESGKALYYAESPISKTTKAIIK